MENTAEKRGSVSIGLIQGKDFGSKQANLEFTLGEIRALAIKVHKLFVHRNYFIRIIFVTNKIRRISI